MASPHAGSECCSSSDHATSSALLRWIESELETNGTLVSTRRAIIYQSLLPRVIAGWFSWSLPDRQCTYGAVAQRVDALLLKDVSSSTERDDCIVADTLIELARVLTADAHVILECHVPLLHHTSPQPLCETDKDNAHGAHSPRCWRNTLHADLQDPSRYPWFEQQAVKIAIRGLHTLMPAMAGNELRSTRVRDLLLHAYHTFPPPSNSVSLPIESLESEEQARKPPGHTPLIQCDAVKVVPSPEGAAPGGGCLVLARPVPAWSTLVQVPMDQLFNLITVKRHCAFAANVVAHLAVEHRIESWGVIDDESLLLVSFCFECFAVAEGASHWKLILQHCPRSFPQIPTYWRAPLLRFLPGDVFAEIARKQERLRTFHKELTEFVRCLLAQLPDGSIDAILGVCKKRGNVGAAAQADGTRRAELTGLLLQDVFTHDNLHFCRAVFDSRALQLNYGVHQQLQERLHSEIMLTLAPIVEMINHCPYAHVLTRRVVHSSRGSALALETGRALDASLVGREVVMSYGPLQNWELLLSYGFVLTSSCESVGGSQDTGDERACSNVYDRLDILVPLQPFTDTDEEGVYGDTFSKQRLALACRYHLLQPLLQQGCSAETVAECCELGESLVHEQNNESTASYTAAQEALMSSIRRRLRLRLRIAMPTRSEETMGNDDDDDDDDAGAHLPCFIPSSGVPPLALVALLRLILAQPDEFEQLQRRGPFERLSADTERNVVAAVRAAVGPHLTAAGGADEERDGGEIEERMNEDVVSERQLAAMARQLWVDRQRIAWRVLHHTSVGF